MWKLTSPLIILVLTAIFLFLAATNIQGGWLYFVDALLWSVVLLGIFMPLLQSRRIEIARQIKGTVYTHQPLTLTTFLKNKGRLPLNFMNLTEFQPRALRTTDPKTAPSEVLAQSFIQNLKREQSHPMTSEYRPHVAGLHVLNTARTGSFGALGLLGIYRNQPHTFAFVAQPTPPEVTLNVNSPELQQALKQAHQRHQQPEDISHFRDYAPGDSRRSIHWRNSARQQSLVVGETRQEPLQRAELWVNLHARQDRQTALRLMDQAIAVADLLHNQQLVLHCIAPNAELKFWQQYDLQAPERDIKDVKTWERLSQWLAYLEQDAPEGFEKITQEHQNLQVIVTDHIDPRWLENLPPQSAPVLCFCMTPPAFTLPPGWSTQRI